MVPLATQGQVRRQALRPGPAGRGHPRENNWFHLPGAQNVPHVLTGSGKNTSGVALPGGRGYLHDRPPVALGGLRPEKPGIRQGKQSHRGNGRMEDV